MEFETRIESETTDTCDYLTTAQAAKLSGVCIETIMRWVDSDKIVGAIRDSKGHRRIPLVSLRLFFVVNGKPVPEGLRSGRISAVCYPRVRLPVDPDLRILTCDSLLDFGFCFASGVDLVLLDSTNLDFSAMLQLLTWVSAKSPGTKVATVVETVHDAEFLPKQFCGDTVLVQPIQAETLIKLVRG